MPLSDHEQRLLDQIEQALLAEDPKFASTVRSTDVRSVVRRRLRLAVAFFLLGLVAFVVGAVFPAMAFGIVPIVSLAGFCVMLLAAVYGWSQYKRRGGPALRVVPDRPTAKVQRSGSSIVQRMEDRFRRRFDER